MNKNSILKVCAIVGMCVLASSYIVVAQVDDFADYFTACLESSGGEGYNYHTYGPYTCHDIKVDITDTDPEGCYTYVYIYQYGGSSYYPQTAIYEGGTTGWVDLGTTRSNIYVQIRWYNNGGGLWQYYSDGTIWILTD